LLVKENVIIAIMLFTFFTVLVFTDAVGLTSGDDFEVRHPVVLSHNSLINEILQNNYIFGN